MRKWIFCFTIFEPFCTCSKGHCTLSPKLSSIIKKNWIRFDFLRSRIRSKHFDMKGWRIGKKRIQKCRTQCARTLRKTNKSLNTAQNPCEVMWAVKSRKVIIIWQYSEASLHVPVLRSTPTSAPVSLNSLCSFTRVSWGSKPEFWARTLKEERNTSHSQTPEHKKHVHSLSIHVRPYEICLIWFFSKLCFSVWISLDCFFFLDSFLMV